MKITMFDMAFNRLERQDNTFFYWHIWDENGTEYYISDKYGMICIAYLEDYSKLHECEKIPEPYDGLTPRTTKQMLDVLGAVYEDLPIEFESDI